MSTWQQQWALVCSQPETVKAHLCVADDCCVHGVGRTKVRDPLFRFVRFLVWLFGCLFKTTPQTTLTFSLFAETGLWVGLGLSPSAFEPDCVWVGPVDFGLLVRGAGGLLNLAIPSPFLRNGRFPATSWDWLSRNNWERRNEVQTIHTGWHTVYQQKPRNAPFLLPFSVALPTILQRSSWRLQFLQSVCRRRPQEPVCCLPRPSTERKKTFEFHRHDILNEQFTGWRTAWIHITNLLCVADFFLLLRLRPFGFFLDSFCFLCGNILLVFCFVLLDSFWVKRSFTIRVGVILLQIRTSVSGWRCFGFHSWFGQNYFLFHFHWIRVWHSSRVLASWGRILHWASRESLEQ